eukprot:1635037-Prymnesium_polylepis.1
MEGGGGCGVPSASVRSAPAGRQSLAGVAAARASPTPRATYAIGLKSRACKAESTYSELAYAGKRVVRAGRPSAMSSLCVA